MKKIILFVFLILAVMTVNRAFAWDESFSFSSPSGTTDAGTIDTEITDGFKKPICERLNQDHHFPETSAGINDLTCGYHRKATLKYLAADPSAVTDSFILYSKYDGSDVEAYGIDDSSNVVQITKDGALAYADPAVFQNLTVSGDATVDGDLFVYTNAVVSGEASITGNFEVGGSTIASAGLSVNGVTKIFANSFVSKSFNTDYQALTDGYVYSWSDTDAGGGSISLFVEYGDATPDVLRIINSCQAATGTGLSAIVAKDEYWKVTVTDTTSGLWWKPAGSE